MIRKFCTVAGMVFLLAFAAFAQGPVTQNPITDLAYSAQPGKQLYLTGKYQGQTVNMVRTGALGVGKLTVYTGTPTDRVRLTIDDNKGLQEILALDKGQRMTLNRVGQERIEYRLYAPDRRFIIGSVLYRKDGRWMQGLMTSEAFAGYSVLTGVTDVSEKFAFQSTEPKLDLARWFKNAWQNIHLISTAHAQEEENLIQGFFSQSAQDARQRWSAPLHEMFKGSLVGAAAFTVKLVGQTVAAGEAVALGGAVAAAAPFLVAVGTGVAVGIAADRVYNWAEGKNLGGSASVRDLYDRLVAGTRFSNEAGQLPPMPSVANAPVRAPSSSLSGLLDMVDKQDKLDKQDFRASLDIADACTRKRDFACANEQLADASKLASSAADRQSIASARQGIEVEKSRVAEEARVRAAAERQRAEAEQQRIAQAERQRQQQAEASKSSGFQWGKAGALLAGSAIGGIGKLSGETQVKIITGILQDSSAGQTGIGNTTAALNSSAPSGSGRNSAQQAASPAVGAGSRSSEVWHDDYSNQVIATGVVKQYPDHERNIPGDVVASKMSSMSAAQAVWGAQGGTVTEYSGCGACGVGSSIKVVVKFSSIIDTHIFRRDK